MSEWTQERRERLIERLLWDLATAKGLSVEQMALHYELPPSLTR